MKKADKKPSEHEGMLEEYRQLRDEMIGYLTSGHYNRYYAFLISLGVLSAGAALPLSPFVFPTVALLVAILWLIDIEKLKSIFRIATYIELFIEPEIPGLAWETRIALNQKLRLSFRQSLFGRLDFAILYCLHAAFAAYNVAQRYPVVSLVLIIGLTITLIMLVKASYVVWARGRSEQKEFWQSVKRKGMPARK